VNSIGTPPSTRSEHSMFTYNNKFYIFGGWAGTNLTYYNDLYSYDPTTNTWSVITTNSAPLARYGAASVVVGTSLYVIGGMLSGTTISSGLYICDLSVVSPTWTQSTVSLSIARYRMSAVAYTPQGQSITRTIIYLYGGDTKTSTPGPTAGLMTYNLRTNKFAAVTLKAGSGTGPGNCAGYAVFINGTNIYLYGGYISATASSNGLYVFDISAAKWNSIALNTSLLSSSRCLCAFASNGTTFYVDGGSSTNTGATTYNDTWSVSILPTLVATLLPGKVTSVNSQTFTLNGVIFKATLVGIYAAVGVTVTQAAASGQIISLVGLRVSL